MTIWSAPEIRYAVMRDALLKQNRPIFYSMCELGVNGPTTLVKPVGNSLNTKGDIFNSWDSMFENPEGWNDPDML